MESRNAEESNLPQMQFVREVAIFLSASVADSTLFHRSSETSLSAMPQTYASAELFLTCSTWFCYIMQQYTDISCLIWVTFIMASLFPSSKSVCCKLPIHNKLPIANDVMIAKKITKSIKSNQMLEWRSFVTRLVTAMQSSIQSSMSGVKAALWRCSEHTFMHTTIYKAFTCKLYTAIIAHSNTEASGKLNSTVHGSPHTSH